MAAEVQELMSVELRKLISRTKRFVRIGFTVKEAEILAATDVHPTYAARMLNSGCSTATAFEILR